MPDLRFTPQAAHTPRSRAPSAPRVSGRSATPSRSTRTSSPRRTTTRSTCGTASSTPTPAGASTRSTRPTCAVASAGWASTRSAHRASTAARPPMLEEEELDDSYFMMRVRTDGAILDAAALRALGEIVGRLRPQHRRHHRPQQHPVPLDRDRERPGDLGAPRDGRPVTPRGVRRQPAPVPRLPRRRHRQGRDHRRLRGARRDQAPHLGNPEYSNLPRKFKTALTGHPEPRRRARDQRRRVRRHRPPRARPRLRPLGRRRPVHQPDARPQARCLDPPRRGGRRVGGRRRHVPRLRLPAPALQGPPEVPARRLGQGEVP